MSEWLPIEIAPKDGTEILAWGPEDDHCYAGMGVIWYSDEDDAFIEGEIGPVDGEYTHWQPLPSPPK